MTRTPVPKKSDVPLRLGRLTATEQRIWRAFPRGEPVDLRTGDASLDAPANSGRWGADRVVRGEVIAALLLGVRPAAPGAVGAVRIVGARITGELSVGHGQVAAPLLLRGCCFDGAVNLDEAVTGSIDLSGSRLTTLSAYGAHVRGTLSLHGTVVNGTSELAVRADGITVDGSLDADEVAVTGSFSLINAVIGGQVTFNSAKLTNSSPDGKSLTAGGMRVGRSLLARELTAVGEVRLPGAHIGSALLLDGATLTGGQDGSAFQGEGLTVASSAYFRTSVRTSVRASVHKDRPTESASTNEPAEPVRFTATGTVRLVGARIGGGLYFGGAKLTRVTSPSGGDGTATKERPVLAASRMVVDGSLYFDEKFSTDGELRLTGTRITGHLDLRDMDSPDALLTLYAATAVGGVRDDLDSWPRRLNLDGFTYDSFSHYLDARQRIGLLTRQVKRGAPRETGGFRAQPYEQLASYYRGLGNDGEARTVLLAKQRAQRRQLPWWQRVPSHLLDLLVGYGYRPLRAIAWAVGLLAAASVYFAQVKPQHVSTEDHSVFNPVLFAADHLVPVIHFGQPEVWQYHGAAAVVTVVLTVLGWTLGIAIAAAATRTLTRS
ncbi:hypothetical protein [Kitasatospora sp. MAP5-34]|uniref:hypothetical protein n=1 Tax=Kitasatospora sp. MAP5-34 TaxID=3035102 RepID=UPI0024757D52|nr:hypothetical protein [Kitasatospora sp. MAP5-34]